MQARTLEADYLVIGAGAVGMSFLDVLLAESSATAILVDRHHRPGGHWNDAYPFVRLHSPAAYYGVTSTPLGSGLIERAGDNAGLYDLASGREISAYFDRVLEKLLATGRLRYFPMSDYHGGGEFSSLLSGARSQVRFHKKLVDTTHTATEVPSTHKPKYEVAAGVRCVPINELVRVQAPAAGYVIIGGGKTAIDACLWLLDRGVAPGTIRWIRPREAWLHNRAQTQPAVHGPALMAGAAVQMEEATRASSLDDLFLRLEARAQLLRIDTKVMPTMFRGATVSQGELAKLRLVEDVVRLGRVRRIERKRILLEQGSVSTSPDALYIDCSANGIALSQQQRPIFEPSRITVQCVRYLHTTLSAALIGYLEATRPGQIEGNNALCRPLAFAEVPSDWLRLTLAHAANSQRAAQDGLLRAWESRCRLNPMFGAPASGVEPAWDEARQRYRASVQSGMTRLRALLDAADEGPASAAPSRARVA